MHGEIFGTWSSLTLPHKFDVGLCFTDETMINWGYDSRYKVTYKIIEFILKTVIKEVDKFYGKTVKKVCVKSFGKN